MSHAVTAMSPNIGAVADSVTISGYGFGAVRGGSTVAFGAIAVASYVSWSDTTVVVVVPASTVSARVKVTVGGVIQVDYRASWFELLDATIDSIMVDLRAQDETADATPENRLYAEAKDYNGLLNFLYNRIEQRVLNVIVLTSGAGATMALTTNVEVVNKSAGSATAITLPASPPIGLTCTVKDGKGDANSNNITVTPNAGMIDGAASSVINTNYGARNFLYNGTEWNVI